MELTDVLKPEYLFQPKVALLRLLPFKTKLKSEFVEKVLPWGTKLRLRPLEEHGQILLTLGVIDLTVTETLWRLTDPGSVAVDVGANIGYMTGVLASRVETQSGGKIWAFEAHPDIFKELTYNTRELQSQFPNTNFYIEHKAVSDKEGCIQLGIPEGFSENQGLAFVMNSENELNKSNMKDIKTISVQSVSLDGVFPSPSKIDILKLDVEGHELTVLKGAEKLITQGRIRDCVFEEHRDYPTPVTQYLKDNGYEIFRIQRSLFKPLLLSPDSEVPKTKWLPTSFLATKDATRATERFQKAGWQVLKKNS